LRQKESPPAATDKRTLHSISTRDAPSSAFLLLLLLLLYDLIFLTIVLVLLSLFTTRVQYTRRKRAAVPQHSSRRNASLREGSNGLNEMRRVQQPLRPGREGQTC